MADEKQLEEFAADMAAPNPSVQMKEKPRYMGWVALVISVISLFLWPVIMGPAGAITGFIAMSQGQRTLGIWAIVMGLISFLAYFFLVPYYS